MFLKELGQHIEIARQDRGQPSVAWLSPRKQREFATKYSYQEVYLNGSLTLYQAALGETLMANPAGYVTDALAKDYYKQNPQYNAEKLTWWMQTSGDGDGGSGGGCPSFIQSSQWPSILAVLHEALADGDGAAIPTNPGQNQNQSQNQDKAGQPQHVGSSMILRSTRSSMVVLPVCLIAVPVEATLLLRSVKLIVV